MKGLVEYIARSIVEAPDEVTISEAEGERGIVLRLQVAPDDKGRVIGKQGQVAQAMRTLLRVAGTRAHARVQLEIV
ncbi:MAG: KH domain-containing protein [Dehalococcoidia bacterium]|nr:KH domain-containing protein [Dehalococcoidia bacterium]MDP6783452.1 KH domain-containing protein [Dehalococcoidia bacterium]